MQREALELVSGFPGSRKEPGPGQVEALLRIDARLEPVIAQLTQQYTINYQKSTAVESRLWHSVFDLVKAFTAAYQIALKSGYPRTQSKRWRATLPWVLVRLAHYKGLDGKFRLFRYSHWIPAQWREFHELYEFARMRGWQREQLVYRRRRILQAGRLVRAGIPEDAAADAPRLRQFHAGPGRVGVAAARGLDAHAGADAAAVGGRAVLRRPGRQRGLAPPRPAAQPADGCCSSTRAPSMRASSSGCAGCPSTTRRSPSQGDLPSREQRLLLMRLASLFGPDAIAQAPRAARYATDGDVRVVVGLQALTRAVAEIERLPEQARTPGVAASYDEVTQMVNPTANPESVARRIRGTTWKLTDRSDIRLPAAGAGQGRAGQAGRTASRSRTATSGCWPSSAGCSASRSTR